ncbi:uncharacterized protein [Physcomitrium patens]|uniref:Uncharacterized protein n=1 Tax=Physcomitrium patens TaxID=3218 RepID=A0A7I4CIF8_PHYPA|nr:uncharacterized protein LOC112276651 isoform X1 [Physcomitrium patens]|eukprot:XP_024363910.1 uncharacterized protein LOC112276651 isoform X1 [Physcomitrella patens]
MGGGAGVRVVHGTIAAAAALLATAASTVDIGDKLHLKVTPILFYAVPISIPLPPLSSLSGACGCTDRSSFSVSYSRILPSKECEASSFASASSSISPPGATAGKGQNFQGWRPYMSVLQLYTEPPLTPTKLSTCVAKIWSHYQANLSARRSYRGENEGCVSVSAPVLDLEPQVVSSEVTTYKRPFIPLFRSHSYLYNEQLSNFHEEVLPSTHAHAIAH